MALEDLRTRAARALKDGARLPGGWTVRVTSEDGGETTIALQPPAVRLQLHGEAALVVDARPQPSALADGLRGALDHLRASLAQRLGAAVQGAPEREPNVREAPVATRVSRATGPIAQPGVVYLVPGHLGDPRDLSPRTLQLLAEIDVVVLEVGPTRGFESILERCGVAFRGRVEQVGGPTRDKEALATRLLADLDAGASVALFGADEGIPAFCDPGDELVAMLRARRPELTVRTVGGPSALGCALMTLDLPTSAFTFLGVLLAPRPTQFAQVVEALRTLAASPQTAVLFTDGATARALVAHLAAEAPDLRIELAMAVDLTRPTERYLRGPSDDDAVLAGVALLGDEAKVVLAMFPSWRDGAEEQRGRRAVHLSVV